MTLDNKRTHGSITDEETSLIEETRGSGESLGKKERNGTDFSDRSIAYDDAFNRLHDN